MERYVQQQGLMSCMCGQTSVLLREMPCLPGMARLLFATMTPKFHLGTMQAVNPFPPSPNIPPGMASMAASMMSNMTPEDMQQMASMARTMGGMGGPGGCPC